MQSFLYWLTDPMVLESQRRHLPAIEKISAIEDQWPCHRTFDELPIKVLETWPLGYDHESIGILGYLVRCIAISNARQNGFSFLHCLGVEDL